MAEQLQDRWNIGNEHNRCVGADLASATTIAVTHRIHKVTGTVAIATITLPYPTFSGEIILIPTGAWTTTTAGNIATAVTAVVDRPLHFTYHPGIGKWHAHAIA